MDEQEKVETPVEEEGEPAVKLENETKSEPEESPKETPSSEDSDDAADLKAAINSVSDKLDAILTLLSKDDTQEPEPESDDTDSIEAFKNL